MLTQPTPLFLFFRKINTKNVFDGEKIESTTTIKTYKNKNKNKNKF